ncbi:MAG: 30S ribosomal protein S8 [Proteobacteria bacterium]|nr:30S ribosomal protein S8 [Desulfobacteraceae bacterium]MBU4319134.1 30S ribosomal protein S8 [Pseudomonadota bacterium]MBU4469257.1 30S ribosomal protein S8 [Pseudomonadota bacterium]MCG2752287.1 30S ribosomal protein S8 [Desulfobacteraceae bacterium]
MAMSDPIADMLTRIRNAAKAKFNSVDIPGSNFKTDLTKVLTEAGYIKNFKFIQDDKQGVLRLYLKYADGNKNAIVGLQRVSKPSRRVYVKAKDIKPILNGMGVSILSTSKGIMTDKKAKKENMGGELICNVW